jgi:hypothetical protein
MVFTRGPLWKEATLALCLSGLFMGYFFLNSSNYGGHSYSIRWFVTLIPLMWFFAFPYFSNWTNRKMWGFTLLFSFSLLVALVGALDQWPPTLLSPGRPAFAINLRNQVKPMIVRVADAMK